MSTLISTSNHQQRVCFRQFRSPAGRGFLARPLASFPSSLVRSIDRPCPFPLPCLPSSSLQLLWRCHAMPAATDLPDRLPTNLIQRRASDRPTGRDHARSYNRGSRSRVPILQNCFNYYEISSLYFPQLKCGIA